MDYIETAYHRIVMGENSNTSMKESSAAQRVVVFDPEPLLTGLCIQNVFVYLALCPQMLGDRWALELDWEQI